MNISNQKTIDELYNKLSDYLRLNGIDPSHKFKCIYEDHDDGIPSMSIIPTNPHLAFCFGCNRSCNIFHAAAELEKLPIRGADFYKVTLPTLAEKLNVSYKPVEISEDEKEYYRLLAAYKDAADIICTYPEDNSIYNTPIFDYLNERGWKIETARLLKIGAIPSKSSFVSQMNAKGWEDLYLKANGLWDSELFSRDRLIFTVCDTNGRPRGFAARNMRYDPQGEYTGPKYKNTKDTRIYSKRELLYGFNLGKKNIKNGDPLWIVEGYADVPTLWESGIKNIAGVGGTAFCEGHIDLLAAHDIYKINFLYDNDNYQGMKKGGQEALKNIIKDHFMSSSIFKVKIKELPKNTDPDEFFKEHTMEEFNELPLISPFEWSLRQIPYNADPYDIIQEKIPVIAMEPSAVERDKMIKILSSATDISTSAIQKDVDLQLTKCDKEIMYEKRKWAEFSKYRLNEVFRNHLEPEEIIEEINSRWNNIRRKYKSEDNEEKYYFQKLKDTRKKFIMDSDPVLNMGLFQNLGKLMNGIRCSASFIAISAVPNVGKSSLAKHLLWETVNNNEDVIGLYFTLDDSFSKILAGFFAIETQFAINDIRDANHRIVNNPKKLKTWQDAWTKFNKVKDRFVIKDVTDGSNLAFIEKTIAYYKRKFPKKYPIVVVDSATKLTDYMDKGKEERESLKSKKLKSLTTIFNTPIISVFELRKTQTFEQRPTLLDIKNTRSIEYDADVAIMMHQELHVDKETTLYFYHDTEFGRMKMPIVELNFDKNKESEFKGRTYLKFISNQSRFEEISDNEVFNLISKRSGSTRRQNQQNRVQGEIF